ncbi:hypothetical protein FVEN_g1388 [Fusarium venenatum]|uniref:Zn(2)-C6 fungal-type domain-containing protein n=1 Tax=Fusarium venenatum TaxID=56646 RepID=A0A2L2TGN7_9HYPO|nr:uncharacterized protein FVRRES_13413 [Fusarium venenatum]KAG8360778.1 hypothetical protein FVEN_g1388 [Fusarium venenatum]KAH6979956.1 hypothetical protein EDB82DRAFT_509726 [Fusarium venenatum]CEI41083.1 unnamed protein product [Fusarium venenatum]
METSEPLVEQESGQLNPIACSHCRQRKRKCDRKLPHCLQCNNDPSNCHYPEQNKRGLPIGFITRLEARLAETEEALFRLVQSVEEPENNQVSFKPSSQRKDDRTKEWDSLPLKTSEQVKLWYKNKSGQSDSPVVHDVSMDLDQPESSTHVALPDADRVEISDDIQSNSGADMMLPDAEVQMDSRSEIHTSEVPVGSKAKDMEQKNPHLYF